jgi:Transposase DDE domain
LHSIGRTALVQLQSLLRGFLQDGSFPFGSVLTVKDIIDLISQEWAETCDRICTPMVTLWTFLRQIHSDDPSCRAAVARLNATRVAQGLAPCSPLTGGYCKARQRLPETLLHQLVQMSGQRLQQQTPAAWHWHGRAVKIVDGSGVSMPDTAENQEAYPQPGSQAPGVGFPVARRLVVVLSLACGAVVAAAVGRIKGKHTSENMVFHSLHAYLERDDVVLADRYYCSYWEVALLRGRGIDVVMRAHQRRAVDFRSGQRLGREDHVVSWTKPKRPAWMDEATYAGLPATVAVRELRVRVPQRGFRTRVVLVATTLLDAKVFAKEELAGLYRARWHAEL